jgi:NADPH-dependent curcumin reductase CurA
MEMLKNLGIDRVINYKTENLGIVLKKEYPKGINVLFESVGGKMLQDGVDNMAVKGKVLIIGAIRNYANEGKMLEWDKIDSLKLLNKSIEVNGFFLPHFGEEIKKCLPKLVSAIHEGSIKVITDSNFYGLDSVKDAVSYLQRGKNIGKVVVCLKNIPSKV